MCHTELGCNMRASPRLDWTHHFSNACCHSWPQSETRPSSHLLPHVQQLHNRWLAGQCSQYAQLSAHVAGQLPLLLQVADLQGHHRAALPVAGAVHLHGGVCRHHVDARSQQA